MKQDKQEKQERRHTNLEIYPSHACRQMSPSCKRHKALSCALACASKDSRDPAVVVPARRSLESSIEKPGHNRCQDGQPKVQRKRSLAVLCAASRTVPARLQGPRTLFEAQKSFLTQAVVLRSWYARGCADQKGRDRVVGSSRHLQTRSSARSGVENSSRSGRVSSSGACIPHTLLNPEA